MENLIDKYLYLWLTVYRFLNPLMIVNSPYLGGMAMIDTNRNPEYFSDVEKPTDTEIVLYLLRLMDTARGIKGPQGQDVGRNIMHEIVDNALKTITNPYARKLLIDRMA